MEDLKIKYDLLDPPTQKEVQDFIDFLLKKKEDEMQAKEGNSYQEKILDVSTWPEEDLKVFDINRKFFNQWRISEW